MDVTACRGCPNPQVLIRTCRVILKNTERRRILLIAPVIRSAKKDCTGVNILFAEKLSVHVAPVSRHLQADFPVALFVPLGGLSSEPALRSDHLQSFCSPVVLIPAVQLCRDTAHCLTLSSLLISLLFLLSLFFSFFPSLYFFLP
jgi:hypothetical protein